MARPRLGNIVSLLVMVDMTVWLALNSGSRDAYIQTRADVLERFYSIGDLNIGQPYQLLVLAGNSGRCPEI
jgi:hypothetical protein